MSSNNLSGVGVPRSHNRVTRRPTFAQVFLVARFAWVSRVRSQPVSETHEALELSIATGDGEISLSATLTLPRSCTRCPTAVLLGVAGPNDRDLSFAGHRLRIPTHAGH